MKKHNYKSYVSVLLESLSFNSTWIPDLELKTYDDLDTLKRGDLVIVLKYLGKTESGSEHFLALTRFGVRVMTSVFSYSVVVK